MRIILPGRAVTGALPPLAPPLLNEDPMKIRIVTEVDDAEADADNTVPRHWIHHYLGAALAELAADHLATTGSRLRFDIVTSDRPRRFSIPPGRAVGE